MRREILHLAAAVVLVDALFIGGYLLFHLERGGSGGKIAYTVAWTVVTLAVVIRALTRIRALRGSGAR